MLYKSPKQIRLENSVNRFIDSIINGKIANKIKDVHAYFFGIGCPEYLYCNETGQYLRYFEKKVRLFKRTEAIITLASSVAGARDYSYLNWFKKRQLLRDLNKSFEHNKRTFRWKRILTIHQL